MYGKMKQHLQEELRLIEEAGLYKKERIIISPQKAEIKIETGQQVLNFCANNYLGLSDHPRLIDAAKRALRERGYGMSSVRFICGTQDYHKELAGKAVVFHVKVNKITVTIVPAQDDEFAKDVSEFDTLEALKADIRAKALEKAQKQADSAFENAAVEKAAENTTVDMPNALVEKELDIQMERFGYQLQMSGYSMEQYAKMMGGDVNTMRNAFRPTAEKQAKISVTLEKIAEVENLTVTAEDIEEEFQSMAKQYEMEEDKIKEMVPMDELTESLKTRKAVKLIVDSAVAVAPKTEEKTEE